MQNRTKILTIYDSPEDNEVLYKVAEEIDFSENDQEALWVTSELLENAKNLGSFSGLAAPQIGISKRAFIYSWDGQAENIEVVINPKIISKSEDTNMNWEACFSAVTDTKTKIALVSRPSEITVEYHNFEGKKFTKRLLNFTARIFLHEYDHLDGIIYDMDDKNRTEEFSSKEDMISFMQTQRDKYQRDALPPIEL